jgi:outer membrane protein TolC
LTQEAERLAKIRYQVGETNLQIWLDEQSRLWGAEQGLLEKQKQQLNNLTTLYLSLGGNAT